MHCKTLVLFINCSNIFYLLCLALSCQTRKYLDAWCVFFWATTPTLFSVFTFGLFTLMGHQLDAATVLWSYLYDALMIKFSSSFSILIIISLVPQQPWGNYLESWLILESFLQVFTCLALFNNLISPLNSFPWVINGLIDVSYANLVLLEV
jgi:ATP-binding cassette subfamily C (CFTR/MRP) protein 10